MSLRGGDDSLQPFDDSPGPGKTWRHDIPILLRPGPMCLGDGPKFLCAGTFSVPVRISSTPRNGLVDSTSSLAALKRIRRRENRPRGAGGSPSTNNDSTNYLKGS